MNHAAAIKGFNVQRRRAVQGSTRFNLKFIDYMFRRLYLEFLYAALFFLPEKASASAELFLSFCRS